MKLALFDIDGTLTDTVGLCNGGFSTAVAAIAGVPDFELVPELWGDATDSGMSRRYFHHVTGRQPTDDEVAAIRAHFTKHLDTAEIQAAPVHGAADVLQAVSARDGWAVGIATGNWLSTARIKFRWVGWELPDLPIGTADDAQARSGILQAAVDRATQWASIGAFDRVVYLGDGVHDLEAAQTIGAGFVGVTAVRGPQLLRDAGARQLLQDFGDHAELFAALDRAAGSV